jgi:hypothetical protein
MDLVEVAGMVQSTTKFRFLAWATAGVPVVLPVIPLKVHHLPHHHHLRLIVEGELTKALIPASGPAACIECDTT